MYFTELMEHQHQHATNGNSSVIENGMMCLYKCDGKKQSHWPICVITECIKSKDGLIRQVRLKTPNGNEYVRSIKHVVPLLNANDEQCSVLSIQQMI